MLRWHTPPLLRKYSTFLGNNSPTVQLSYRGGIPPLRAMVNPCEECTAPKVNWFITLGSELYLVRYNNGLTIVVFAREGVEVCYRVWITGRRPKWLRRVEPALIERQLSNNGMLTCLLPCYRQN
jgi:hypothetical protein